jgi:hypothetical protein
MKNYIRVLYLLLSISVCVSAPALGCVYPDSFNAGAFNTSIWTAADIGNAATPGGSQAETTSLSITASGNDIYGTADGCRFIYQTDNADFDVSLRVNTVPVNNVWSQAGLMVRNSVAANSVEFSMIASNTNNYQAKDRLTTGAATNTSGAGVGAYTNGTDGYVRLSKAGTTLTGYYSADGITWTQVWQRAVTFNAIFLVGIAVTSHQLNTPGTAIAGNFNVAAGACASLTDSPTFTVTQTGTVVFTATPSPTRTATGTATQPMTQTLSPSITQTMTRTNTSTVTPTFSPSSTNSSTQTQTITETVTPTVTDTSSPSATASASPTITDTSSPTRTDTNTFTETETSTRTSTATHTFTDTVTGTITPTLEGNYTVSVDLYDSRGEKVRRLCTSPSGEIVRSVSLSVNPLHANGINTVVIKTSSGEIICVWDGKDNGGRVVFSGAYIIQVKTADNEVSKFILNVPIDVIAENNCNVNVEARYLDDGSIRLTGAAVNVEWVSVKIYNILGGFVKKFGPAGPAGYDFIWDRTGSGGGKVASGIYAAVVEFKDSRTGMISSKIQKIAVKY